MPEQALDELQSFLDLAEGEAMETAPDNDVTMMLLAKGMALQQAGIIPLYTDYNWMLESVKTAVTLEGLLRGH